MKKVFLSMFVLGALMTSCKSDDDTPNPGKEEPVIPTPVNPVTEGNLGQKESFEAIATTHKSFKEKDKTGEELKALYDANIKSHIAVDPYHASSKGMIQDQFAGYLTGWQAALSANVDATQGNVGKIGKRIVNERGIEYEQLFKKGLIGAYQLSNALTEAQKAMAPNANNAEIIANVTAFLLGSYEYLEKGKEMTENHGEQVEGYPVYPGNEFAKYMNSVANNPNFSTVADDLYAALKKAKANIDNKGVFQAEILKAVGVAQKIVAVRGVHYLMTGAAQIEDSSKFESAIHGLSEGFGFYYSLQFTYNSTTHQAYYTKESIDATLNSIDLWNTTASKTTCQELGEEIASKFGFNANDAL